MQIEKTRTDMYRRICSSLISTAQKSFDLNILWPAVSRCSDFFQTSFVLDIVNLEGLSIFTISNYN